MITLMRDCKRDLTQKRNMKDAAKTQFAMGYLYGCREVLEQKWKNPTDASKQRMESLMKLCSLLGIPKEDASSFIEKFTEE